MRDIVARSELSPILNRDRGTIATDAAQQIQQTLDIYQSGISVLRVNLDRADPPQDVIDSFRDVQAARYHPLQEKAQSRLAARVALGLDIDD